MRMRRHSTAAAWRLAHTFVRDRLSASSGSLHASDGSVRHSFRIGSHSSIASTPQLPTGSGGGADFVELTHALSVQLVRTTNSSEIGILTYHLRNGSHLGRSLVELALHVVAR
jgi:hypothetical protein